MIRQRIDREKKIILYLAILTVLVYVLTFGIKAIAKNNSAEDLNNIEQVKLSFVPVQVSVDEETMPYSLTKVDSGWAFDDNSDISVARWNVNFMISALKDLNPERILTGDNLNLTEFGLDKPKAIITLKGAQGEEKIYKLGNYNSALRQYYLSVEGNDCVYLIALDDAHLIDKTKLQLIDGPSVVGTSISDINVIEVKGENHYTAKRNDEGFEVKWEDVIFQSSEYRVSYIYAAFNSATYECKEYDASKKELTKYGLSNPEITVRITAASGSEFKLSVGTPADGNHYVVENDNGTIYQIDNTSYENLLQYITLYNLGYTA